MSRLRLPATLALTAALTVPCLTSCGTEYRVIRNDIPLVLTVPCDSPELSGETDGDSIRLAYRQRIALAECDARMTAIRNLTEGAENASNAH